jgi:hypothetical protein
VLAGWPLSASLGDCAGVLLKAAKAKDAAKIATIFAMTPSVSRPALSVEVFGGSEFIGDSVALRCFSQKNRVSFSWVMRSSVSANLLIR